MLAIAWALCVGPRAAEAATKQHLANGMRIVATGNEHTATVVMTAFVRATALHERAGTRGLRQFTQTMIARGDCCRDLLREAAIRVDASVSADYVQLQLAAPADSLSECSLAMRKMLFEPQWSADAAELVRAGLIRRLAARNEVPTTWAIDRVHERLYPGVGDGGPGSGDVTVIAAVTVDDVADFHARHYLPNATVISLSGGVDEDRALQVVARTMSGLLPGSIPEEAPLPPPGGSADGELIAATGPTGVYCVGARGISLDDPLYPAAAVGIAMLGSGMDSRLYRALRLERALSYTIGAELTPSLTAPSAIVLVTCDPQKLNDVMDAVDAQIDSIMDEPAGPSELRRAKRYLIGRHALQRQRNAEIAHYLGLFELIGGPSGYRRDSRLAGEIAAVDAVDVRDAMREIFDETWAVRLNGPDAAEQ